MYKIGTLYVVAALFPFGVVAGAWPQKAGEGMLILNSTYYTADEYFDNSGKTTSLPRFDKYELNPYLEYGYSDAITLGANIYLEHNTSDGLASAPPNDNTGLGDSEFFLRARLWEQGRFVISAEPLIKLPSPSANTQSGSVGSDNIDVAMGLSFGYGLPMYGRNHYVNLDTSYRYRTGGQADQIRLAATAGINLTPQIQLLPQAFAYYRTSDPYQASFTQSPEDDYNLLKLQLSAVYHFKTVSVQAGGFIHAEGENTGAGHGGLFSVWRKF